MQRSDLLLVLLAAVALVATAVGAAVSDRWSGEHTVSYATADLPLVGQGPTDAAGAGAAFEWLVPDNSTSAVLQVAVSFSGQAVQGGAATITVRATTPDGRFASDKTVALSIPAGATSGATKVDLDLSWAPVPSTVRDGRGATPAALEWDAPLKILVVASQPSDVPVASYAFSASVSGTVDVYHAE